MTGIPDDRVKTSGDPKDTRDLPDDESAQGKKKGNGDSKLSDNKRDPLTGEPEWKERIKRRTGGG